MRQRQLVDAFKQAGVVDPPDYPVGQSLSLLTKVGSLYERLGLLDAMRPQPLWRCCPHGPECWEGTQRPRRSKTNSGQITLPWIGPEYQPGGVVVVAINLHNASGLLTEYEIVCSSAGSEEHPSQIGSFEAGHRQAHRTPFAYRSMRSTAMLLDALDGVRVTDRSDPGDLIEPVNRIARLQSVKCAPPDRGRGSPTRAMRANCPPLLLRRELEILEPRAVITFGELARRAVMSIPDHQLLPGRGTISRGYLRIGDNTCRTYSLAHPVAAAQWSAGHHALKRHLERNSTSALDNSPPAMDQQNAPRN